MSFQYTQTWKRTAVAFTCSLVCATAGVAFADAASDARKSIQATYDAESAAIGKHDVNATYRAYASDYVFINEKGDKEEFGAVQSLGKVHDDGHEDPYGHAESSDAHAEEE